MLLDNIKVAIRIRPFNKRELETSDNSTLKVIDQETLIAIPPVEAEAKQGKKTYKFNWIFDKIASQKDIFEKTLEYQVLSVLDGINVTLFSYGASGTGKTHTLMKLNEDHGLLIRALNQIFQTIHNKKRKIQMKFSYLEFQQEQLYDLLNNMNSNLDIRDDVEKGVIINGMREIDIASTQEVINLIQYGKRQKSTKQHEILIFTNYIQDIIGQNNEIQVSKFIVADLAWFDKSGQKSASLQVLNDCISLLSEAQNKKIQPFIPYRNSKLTKILKDSFGGNSKTLIIGCVSPSIMNYEETIQTLEYCSLATGIYNQGSIKNLQQSTHQDNFKQVYDQLINENVELKKLLNNNNKSSQKPINNDKEQTKLYEENILEHFNNEQDINQSIFKYQWEIEQIKFTINENQENLQRIDGIDRKAADSLRYQIEQDQKQLHNYQEQLIKFQKQTSNFIIQRRALEENVNQSNLQNSYKLYLINLIEKHILRLEVYEIKLKEQINELHRQQHERIMAIQRSQINLRDRIIADQRKHIIQHGKNQSVQHYSQIDTTTEVIDGTKAKLKHYPLPKVKDHYFNREAYLQRKESPKSIFSPRLQTPLQLKDIKPYVPKTPHTNILENLSTPILPKSNPFQKAPPQKIIDSQSMVALPLITTNRNLSKFVYDWRGGGYKFIEDQKKIPSQRELKHIIQSKQHTQQSLDKSFFTTSSRSTSAKRVSFKQNLLLPGKVHESPYVKEFINKEIQRKIKLKQLNQKMMKVTQKK
ncbi:unnamed protein product [Paramecium primaurelia]|uniref:Kinesin motor domain-containing protein n=1 Tax=Paramecium primaurelia TaxID=5886 RepID=A0A8S1KA56_PARPR|nr:unnamed protein product [Paramecium primaurelia]